MTIYRHGDLVLVQVSQKPQGDFYKSKDTVLLEGENQNHFHRLQSNNATIEKTTPTKDNKWMLGWFNISETTPLTHEEHKVIELPTGIYKFFSQREHDNQEERRVVD
jgi:hypothetical protein